MNLLHDFVDFEKKKEILTFRTILILEVKLTL